MLGQIRLGKALPPGSSISNVSARYSIAHAPDDSWASLPAPRVLQVHVSDVDRCLKFEHLKRFTTLADLADSIIHKLWVSQPGDH
eukprot:958959-Rhodomonas_salina.4